MSVVEASQNKSRGRADDVDCDPRKRRRVMSAEPSAPIELASKFRFVEFHYKMLKSLYDDEKSTLVANSGEDDTSSSGEVVDERVWDKIRDFLVDRPRISHSKKEADLWGSIRQEAMQLSASSNKTRSPTKQTPGRMGLAPLSSAFHYLSNSPISSPSKPPQPSENSFFIIAQFLGKEALVFKDAYTHQKNALKPLLALSEQLIHRLAQDVTVLNQAIAKDEQKKLHLLLNGASCENNATKQDIGRGSNASRLAELQTKMRLWQLLEADLRSIL